MILMSTFLLGEVPFRTVYLHGLVRDAQGRKMSKSLNNGIDPLDMIKKYGADATRLSLVIGVAPGGDLNLSEDKVRSFRNFGTKIWNAARFLLMNRPANYSSASAKPRLTAADKKHLTRLAAVKKKITTHYDKFELHLAGETAYAYFWDEFANGVLEKYKEKLHSGSPRERAAAYYLLETILRECLKLLHPFIPFVTEAVWQNIRNSDQKRRSRPDNQPFLMVNKW